MIRDTSKRILTVILTLIARGILLRKKPKVIAVTGSVGKTSTKDAIYVVLKNLGSIRRSEKSFNSALGVPLSIIGAPSGWNNPFAWLGIIGFGIKIMLSSKPYPKTLVLEVGADRPGDIARVAKWLRPDVVVITRLPDVPAHIEFFPTLDSLIEEKLSLARYMKPTGTLVLNADDSRVFEAKEKMKMRTITYGMSTDAMLRASSVGFLSESESGGAGGITFKLDFDGKSFPVFLPNIYARSFVSVALASLAVAYSEGYNIIDAINALCEYETPPGRVRVIQGKNNTTLIDDTYNSSPAASEAGIIMLGEIPLGKRKIAVIGDMLELGKYTDEAHTKIGALSAKNADILITVGQRAELCAKGARNAGMNEKKIFSVADAKEAGEKVLEILKPHDVIFVKGSQGVRMERTVSMLMANPEEAEELLVRQDGEWQKKA